MIGDVLSPGAVPLAIATGLLLATLDESRRARWTNRAAIERFQAERDRVERVRADSEEARHRFLRERVHRAIKIAGETTARIARHQRLTDGMHSAGTWGRSSLRRTMPSLFD
jgi:hypothetical protein